MATRRVTVIVDAWVVPYLQLLQRLGCGSACERAVKAFVFENGVRVAP